MWRVASGQRLCADGPGPWPRALGAGGGRNRAESAADRYRLVADDHRRTVYLRLGLGAGLWTSGTLSRQRMGLARGRILRFRRRPGQAHHGVVGAIFRSLPSHEPGVSAAAVERTILADDRARRAGRRTDSRVELAKRLGDATAH